MKKTLSFLSALVLSVCTLESNAQLPDGSIAPNFTFTDMNGNTQDLYTYLNSGKSVVIDIFATWCSPCWDYHTSGELENFYNQQGPSGTDKARVIGIEGDYKTPDSDLTGGGGSMGNWLAGTPYPMCNPPSAAINPTFYNNYNVSYFPLMYLICTNKKTLLVDQYTASQLTQALGTCTGTNSVGDLDANASVSVFPNPSTGNVYITDNGLFTGDVKISVTNVMGQVIFETKITNPAGIASRLDLAAQPDGLYFVEVNSAEYKAVKKIVLNR